jgi:predicted O-methyltransferase YrrM
MSEKQLIEALLTGKPYFGTAMRALQGPPVRHRYLSAIVQSLSRLKFQGDISILEIGSWAGASAITWATAMRTVGRNGRITCVDLWQSYFDLTIEHETHYKEMSDAAKDSKIFNLFLHNIRAANILDMVDYLIGNARDVLPNLQSEEFDIIYIDGSHAYEDVRSDICQAKRLVRNGGIICGDDLELQKHNLDEREHQAAVVLGKDYVYSLQGYANYHPGVTEAVANEFGNVATWEGVWAMRKVGKEWTTIDLDLSHAEMPAHIANACATIEIAEVGQTRDFWLGRCDANFLAVAKSLGPTKLFVERLGERELPSILFTGESLEEIRAKAVKVEQETKVQTELIGETATFNLVKSRGRFLAVAKRLGPTELFSERLGERELAPLLLVGEALDEVREKAYASERHTAEPEVELVSEIGSYNVVRVDERFIAVAKSLGPLTLFRERVGERDFPPLILLASDAATLRRRIFEIDQKDSKDQDLP